MTYEEMWQKMLAHAEEFDFSNYPVDSRHRSAENPHLRGNTKRINVMKDEMGMAPILEYVGLRAKVYSLLVAPKVVAKMENFVPVKCKGANQPVFYHLPMLIYSQIRRFKILHFFKKQFLISGVVKAAVKHQIHHEHLLKYLTATGKMRVTFNRIISKDHHVTTISQTKVLRCALRLVRASVRVRACVCAC